MTKHNTLYLVFFFSLLFSFNCQAEQSLLNDMQIKLENNHTQAEFVVIGPVTPKISQFTNPERIVIDFPATAFGKRLEVSNPSTSSIDKVKGSKPDQDSLRFTFELKHPVQARSRVISGNILGQQKFIIDLLPPEAKAAKKAVTASSATPSKKSKTGEPDWKEHLKVLNQRFANQEKKIRELQMVVEQQGRLLAMRQKGGQIPPSAASPASHSTVTQQEMKLKKTKPVAKKEKVKRRPPREKGIETVLREEHAIFEHGFTIEPGFSYTRTDRNRVALSGFLVLDAIALGKISVDEVESDVLLFDLTSRYGVTDKLQLDVNIPFLHRSSTYRNTASVGNAPEEVERTVDLAFALSDISFGFSYQLLGESNLWPDVVWSTRVRAPSGIHPFGIKTIDVKAKDDGSTDVAVDENAQNGDSNNQVSYPEKLPSGNGLWAVTSGFSFVKTLDPAVMFASVSYTYNIEDDFRDISTRLDEVAPGTVDLGNSYQFGLGFAVALNERMTMSISYAHRYSETSKTRVVGGQWNKILGSDANSSQLNFGLVYALTPKFSVVASVAAGLTNDAPDSQFSLKFPFTF